MAGTATSAVVLVIATARYSPAPTCCSTTPSHSVANRKRTVVGWLYVSTRLVKQPVRSARRRSFICRSNAGLLAPNCANRSADQARLKTNLDSPARRRYTSRHAIDRAAHVFAVAGRGNGSALRELVRQR